MPSIALFLTGFTSRISQRTACVSWQSVPCVFLWFPSFLAKIEHSTAFSSFFLVLSLSRTIYQHLFHRTCGIRCWILGPFWYWVSYHLCLFMDFLTTFWQTSSLCVCMVPGFELRALHIPGRCSTTWASALSFFERLKRVWILPAFLGLRWQSAVVSVNPEICFSPFVIIIKLKMLTVASTMWPKTDLRFLSPVLLKEMPLTL